MYLRLFLMSILMFFSLNSMAFFDSPKGLFEENEKLLSADMAFKPDLILSNDEILLTFSVNDNYHIYADKLLVKVNGSRVELNGGKSVVVDDYFFGRVDVYKQYNQFNILNVDKKNEKLKIDVEYQGCASNLNVCYPVENYYAEFDNPDYNLDYVGSDIIMPKSDLKDISVSAVDIESSGSIAGYLNELSGDSILLTYLLGFLLGVIVAFTPCIYPMIPIITGIVIKNKNDSPVKLTSYYVLGMALCYMSLFIFMNTLNVNIQTIMMNNITSFITGLILVLLSLVVLGFIGFNLPSSFQTGISGVNEKLSKKNSIALIPSGFLSALILSPCATAPLAGVLLFASVLTDGYGIIYGSLFVLTFGLGVGFPIVLFTTYLKKYMPKNGKWMNLVKYILGFAILSIGFSILIKSLENYINSETINVLILIFNILIIVALVELIIKDRVGLKEYLKRIIRYLTIGTLSFSFTLFLNEKFDNMSNNGGFNINEWILVDNIDDMKNLINNGKKTIVFVSADWCVVCDKLKDNVLSDELVRLKIKDYNKIYVDITKRGKREDILDFYGMRLAPYFTFYNSNGDLYNNDKFVGYINDERFLMIIDSID